MKAPVKEQCLLIDFENIQQFNLASLPEDCHVLIFVGSSQHNIPFELVQNAQSLGTRVEWCKIEGNGRNALDFHITYYLGCLFTQCPGIACFILSNDSGFDSLVGHLNRKGLLCRRISSLTELKNDQGRTIEPNYKRVLDSLKNDKCRPSSRKTLTNHIFSVFQKGISQEEVDFMITLLFTEGKIRERNKLISYTF